jgi:hypothetical protein
MNRIFYAFIALMALASCANSYDISGTSNVSTLDGRMLYLKILENNDFKNVDSCDVVHGQFHFQGSVDSMKMANIFMDDDPVLPLVLERGYADCPDMTRLTKKLAKLYGAGEWKHYGEAR